MDLSDEPKVASDDALGMQDRVAPGTATQPVTMRPALPVLDSAHCVPHVAVDDPGCPPGVPPRMSIEMRGTAYWYD